MTKSLPFTENAVVRAINGARNAGLNVGAVTVEPDGSIVLYDVWMASLVMSNRKNQSGPFRR